jgi:outer membrane protein insertion porin family
MPMTINEIRVHGATNTRRTFLDPLLGPLVANGKDAPSSVGEVMAKLQVLSAKLSGLRKCPRMAPQVSLAL